MSLLALRSLLVSILEEGRILGLRVDVSHVLSGLVVEGARFHVVVSVALSGLNL